MITIKKSKDLMNWNRDMANDERIILDIIRSQCKYTQFNIERFIIGQLKENYRTGKLDKSIGREIINSGDVDKYRVYSSEKHSIYIEFGTKKHYISPKKAQALRFYSPRYMKVIYRKGEVLHPGYKGNPAFRMAHIRFLIGLDSRIAGRIKSMKRVR